jgi:hypothetical protein
LMRTTQRNMKGKNNKLGKQTSSDILDKNEITKIRK